MFVSQTPYPEVTDRPMLWSLIGRTIHQALGQFVAIFGVKGHLVTCSVIIHPVIWQNILSRDFFDELSKSLQWPGRPALFVQEIDTNTPFRLIATVLPRQFIESPLEASIQAKIVAIWSQYRAREDGVVE